MGKLLDVIYSEYGDKGTRYAEVKKADDAFFKAMNAIMPHELYLSLEDLAMEYATLMEYQGFMEGFKCAVKLMKECE